MKPQSNFESKWGAACPICKKRKFAVRTSSSAEGGRDSVCKCVEKKQA